MTKKTFEIPVDSFRKIPNPYKEGPSSVSQMYTAICDVKDLPEDLIEAEIKGGCHAYFGMYGAQDGDGTPTISNEEQIRLTAQAIADFIND